jgi:hypothetical protein
MHVQSAEWLLRKFVTPACGGFTTEKTKQGVPRCLIGRDVRFDRTPSVNREASATWCVMPALAASDGGRMNFCGSGAAELL